MTGQVSALI